MEKLSEPIYLRYGGSLKPTSEMNKEEMNAMSEAILKRAKEKAFSRGRPIIYSKMGIIYRQWQDGNVEIIK